MGYSIADWPARALLRACVALLGFSSQLHNSLKFAAVPARPPAAHPPPACLPAALRHVAHALLVGPEAKQASPHALQAAAEAALSGAPVVPSLAYLRDRVGVPRDLPLPAARQLRAHLNWAIDQLQAPASN